MPRAKPAVLLTRPQMQAEDFASLLGDVLVVISPILRIVAVDHDATLLAVAEGVVLTSVHAVPAAAPGRGRPAFCVGTATAEAARRAGFAVTVGPGDMDGLRPLIGDIKQHLIHPHGRHRAGDAGVPGVVVYDQKSQPLNDEARTLLAGDTPVILPLFSPRSARLVAEAVRGAHAQLLPVAISEAVAEAWRAALPGGAAVAGVAKMPDALAVKDTIMPLLSGNNPDRHGLNHHSLRTTKNGGPGLT